jgi:hypothetical protein
VVAATAGVFVTLSVTGGSTGLTATAATAFTINHVPGDMVTIKIVNSAASAQEMTKQLRGQGLDITVKTMSSTAQETGHWVFASFSAQVPQSVSDAVGAQASRQPATITVPAEFPGSLTLVVAVKSY